MILLTINSSLLIISFLGIIAIVGIFFTTFKFMKNKKLDEEEIEELTKELKKEDYKNSIEEEKHEYDEEIDNKVTKNKIDLEKLLVHMQEDLEAKPDEVITNFENDQEEKSIISYQELVDTLKKEKPLINEIEEAKKEDIISIEETEPIKKEIKTDIGEITMVEIPEIKEEKKFKGSEFISPIYGRQRVSDDYPRVKEFKRKTRLDEMIVKDRHNTIEENLDLEPLRKEIKRNDEFLQALKEFRKNL